MIRKIKCKLGLHIHRVYGHCFDTEDQLFEYYYTCVFCPDGFWDYATELKVDESQMKIYEPLKEKLKK